MSRFFAAAGAGLAVLVVSVGAFAASPLEGRWTLVDRQALGAAPGDAPAVTLEIQGDGVAASAGCNRAAGGFQERGGKLEIGPLAATMMACPPAIAKIEARYFSLLESRPSWQIRGDRLTLTGAGATLTFKRAPAQ